MGHSPEGLSNSVPGHLYPRFQCFVLGAHSFWFRSVRAVLLRGGYGLRMPYTGRWCVRRVFPSRTKPRQPLHGHKARTHGFRGSVGMTTTRPDPRSVRMYDCEGPIGAAKGKQTNTTASCPPPPPGTFGQPASTRTCSGAPDPPPQAGLVPTPPPPITIPHPHGGPPANG